MINRVGDPFSGRIRNNDVRKRWQENVTGGQVNGRDTAAGWQEHLARVCAGGQTNVSDAVAAAGRRAENGGGLTECAVRNLTSAESDFVRAYVQEGFLIKAKAYREEGKVYLEQKWEDGTVKAYEADPGKLAGDAGSVLEHAAAAAWERAGQEEEDEAGWLHGEILAFYERVREQIRNGPPKIQTGGSAFGVKEWEKLLEQIDDYLSEVREEQEVRFEKERREKAVERDEAETAGLAAVVPAKGGTAGIELARALEQQALLLREKLCERVVANGKEEEEAETTSRVIVKSDGAKVLEVVTDTGGLEWKMYVEIEKGEEDDRPR